MNKIDFIGLRSRIEGAFGSKIAERLCGMKGLDIQQAIDDDDHEMIHQAGELSSQLAGRHASIYPAKTLKSIYRNDCMAILAACMVNSGVPESLIISFCPWRGDTLGSFLEHPDYIAMKPLFIKSEIRSQLHEALGRHGWSTPRLFALHVLTDKLFRASFTGDKGEFFHGDEPWIALLRDPGASGPQLIEALKAYTLYNGSEKAVRKDFWVMDFLTASVRWIPSIWLIQNMPLDDVMAATDIRLNTLLPYLGLNADSEPFHEFRKVIRAMILAGFPESWKKYAVEPCDLLGIDLLSLEKWKAETNDGGQLLWDLFSHYSGVAKGVIHRDGSESTYSESVLKALLGYCPELASPYLVTRSGARSHAWSRRITDLSPIQGALNALYAKDLWHPLITSDFAQFVEPAQAQKVLLDFLLNGSKARLEMAKTVIDQGLVDMDAAIAELNKKVHFVNLAKVITPTAEQAANIPKKYRGIFLLEQLSV